MCGKFVCLLLVLTCIAQSYEAPSFEFDGFSITLPKLSIDDVIKAITELVDKLKATIVKFGDLLKTLQDKVKEIISQINLPEILADIKKQIEGIIKAGGIDIGAASHCIAAEEKAVEELVKFATEGVNTCMQGIHDVQLKLEAEIAQLSQKAEALIEDIMAKADKCIKDHGINIPETIKCLQGLVDVATEEVTQFIEEIEAAIENSEKIIEDAATDLTDCIAKVSHDISDKKAKIISNFQECIDEITGTTVAQ